MHEAIKKYVDSANKVSLKYALADGFDVDPTYEKYEEDLAYCKKNMQDLFEPYTELTPLTNEKSQWNEAYWLKLKKDIITNFSEERFKHMRAVAKYVFQDKVKRLESERNAERKVSQNIVKNVESPVIQEVRKEGNTLEATVQQTSKSEQQSSKVEQSIPQTTETISSRPTGNTTSVRTGTSYELKNGENNSGESPKKAIGIVLVIAIVLLIIIIGAFRSQSNPKTNTACLVNFAQMELYLR